MNTLYENICTYSLLPGLIDPLTFETVYELYVIVYFPVYFIFVNYLHILYTNFNLFKQIFVTHVAYTTSIKIMLILYNS